MREIAIYLVVLAALEVTFWLGRIYWRALKEVRAERQAEGR